VCRHRSRLSDGIADDFRLLREMLLVEEEPQKPTTSWPVRRSSSWYLRSVAQARRVYVGLDELDHLPHPVQTGAGASRSCTSRARWVSASDEWGVPSVPVETADSVLDRAYKAQGS
jgi:hypothetical protein